MSSLNVHRTPTENERGIALIFSLLALVLLLVLALGVLQTSVASLRTAGNDRTSKAALALPRAAPSTARESLRTQLKAGTTLSAQLTRAANNGSLIDATQLTSFSSSTGLVNNTTNTPFIGPTGFAAGTFQVFLTNDRVEPGAASQTASVQSKVDTNNQIMVTSFGSGVAGSLAVVQEQLRIFDAFLAGGPMPGVIVMPGPTVQFQSFTSNSRQSKGRTTRTPAAFPQSLSHEGRARRSGGLNPVAFSGGPNRASAYQSCPRSTAWPPRTS